MSDKEIQNILDLLLSGDKSSQLLALELIEANKKDIDTKPLARGFHDKSLKFVTESLNPEHFTLDKLSMHAREGEYCLILLNCISNPLYSNQEIMVNCKFYVDPHSISLFIVFQSNSATFNTKMNLPNNWDLWPYNYDINHLDFGEINSDYQKTLKQFLDKYKSEVLDYYSEDIPFENSRLYQDLMNIKFD